MNDEVRVVHRDEELLVLSKPAGLPTTAPDGSDCLVARAHHLDPRAPNLHPSSRLDAEVTGLVTFARTSRANRALLEARAHGTYRRLYLGIARRAPDPATGTWETLLSIEPDDVRKRRVGPGIRQQRAVTDYEAVSVTPDGCLLHLRPRTGRTHQLRVHCAAAGAPLLGDVHYGGDRRVTLADGRVVTARRVMLHCARLSLPHVAGSGLLELAAEVPEDMRSVWLRLGGDAQALRPERV